MSQTAIDHQTLRSHFDAIMKRRSANVSLDRFESGRIQNDGESLHLDIIEVAPSAPTLVFVPGTSVYGLIFGNFLAGMADAGFNVVSFDPRGHGQSSGRRGDYSIDWLVSDAKAAIDYARQRFRGQVFVGGSSQGGIVAFYVAASDADIDGAICHNIADLPNVGKAGLTDHPWIARLIRPLVLGIARIRPHTMFNVKRYYDILSSGDETVKDRLANDPLALQAISFRALASLTTTPLPRPPEQVKTPVLVLHGQDDNIFPLAYTQSLYDALGGPKQLNVYPGIGHFLVTEHPDTIIPDIKSWVKGLAIE